MASVANVPVTVMPWVDGVLHDRGGTPAMFYGEAVLSVAGPPNLADDCLGTFSGSERSDLNGQKNSHPFFGRWVVRLKPGLSSRKLVLQVAKAPRWM